MKRLVFLGTGNMGKAMIKGIIGNLDIKINVYDKNLDKARELEGLKNLKVYDNLKEAVVDSDIVVVSVKPDVVDSLLGEIKDELDGKILVSIAAGYPIRKFINFLGEEASIVRTIPNLPVMVGEGMTGLYFHNLIGADRDFLIDIFNCFGKTLVVNKEEDIDKMVAVTSSSPAFISIFVEALADGAVRSGFTREDSYKMALQTIYGTAKLLEESDIKPCQLKDLVSSPGGTTIEGVASLYETGFRNSVLKAMEAVNKKVNELKKRE